MQEIHIQFNPQKIFKRIVLSLVMLAAGIWLVFGNTSILNHVPKLNDPNLRKFMGWLTILLVFAMIIFLLKCLLSKKSALIIDKVGIEDNSQLISKGIIFWSDIDSIEKTRLGISLLKIPAIKINFKNSGQKPSYLSSSLLKINDEELQNKIKAYLENYR
jgi:hypothetical protein